MRAIVLSSLAVICCSVACKPRNYNGDGGSDTASWCSSMHMCSDQRPTFCISNTTSSNITVQAAGRDVVIGPKSDAVGQGRGSDPASIPTVNIKMNNQQLIAGSKAVWVETPIQPKFTSSGCNDFNRVLAIGLEGETLVFRQP